MNAKKFLILLLFVLLGGVVALVLFDFKEVRQKESVSVVEFDYKDTSFIIDGVAVQLVDGYGEATSSSGASKKTTTKFFGNELMSDLDGDGDTDVAFIITQETGGTGVFYYAVAALKTSDGYIGSDGYFLGDRIAPQSIVPSSNPRHKNVVVFNFAERQVDEPMTAPPSVGKSVYLKLDVERMQWGIVVPDFEGESAL